MACGGMSVLVASEMQSWWVCLQHKWIKEQGSAGADLQSTGAIPHSNSEERDFAARRWAFVHHDHLVNQINIS